MHAVLQRYAKYCTPSLSAQPPRCPLAPGPCPLGPACPRAPACPLSLPALCPHSCLPACLQGKAAEEAIAATSALFTEVQRVVDSKQLKPMIRTQYQRTAFQIPFDPTVRIRWAWHLGCAWAAVGSANPAHPAGCLAGCADLPQQNSLSAAFDLYCCLYCPMCTAHMYRSLDTNLCMMKENPEEGPTTASAGRQAPTPALSHSRTEPAVPKTADSAGRLLRPPLPLLLLLRTAAEHIVIIFPASLPTQFRPWLYCRCTAGGTATPACPSTAPRSLASLTLCWRSSSTWQRRRRRLTGWQSWWTAVRAAVACCPSAGLPGCLVCL